MDVETIDGIGLTGVAEAVGYFLDSMAGARDPRTIAWYKQKLDPMADFVGGTLRDITLRQLERFRASLVGKMSAYTLHGYIRAVRRFFSWCIEEGLLLASPASRLTLPKPGKRPRAGVTDENQALLLAAATTLRDRILFLLLQETWARAEGLCGLNIPDLDLDNCSAVVVEKFDKSRTVHFSDETAELLRKYLGDRKSGPVFVSFRKKNKRLSTGALYQMVKRCAKAAGIYIPKDKTGLEFDEKDRPRWSPHQWRHAGVRSFLQSGSGSLGEASQLAGHSGVGVTAEFYGTFELSELKNIHKRWLNRGKNNCGHAD